MARHRLTKEEQMRGVERALESQRTPPQLKKGLRKREAQLNAGNSQSSSVDEQPSRSSDDTSRGRSSTRSSSRRNSSSSRSSRKSSGGRSRRRNQSR